MLRGEPVVYVVDDDPSVGKALERLMRSAGHDVRTFTSAQDFLDGLDPDTPACLVLDVSMPALDGLGLQELLTRKGIALPIVFLSGCGTVPVSVKALKAGALDFLQKPVNDTELLGTVSRAIDISRQAGREREQIRSLEARLNALTPREREVFQYVAAGMPNKRIASELGTAEKTIKVHRARVMAKMGAHSLVDLARFADKLGIDSAS